MSDVRAPLTMAARRLVWVALMTISVAALGPIVVSAARYRVSRRRHRYRARRVPHRKVRNNMDIRKWSILLATGVAAVAIPFGVTSQSGAHTSTTTPNAIQARTASGGLVTLNPDTQRAQAQAYTMANPLRSGSVYSFGYDDAGNLVLREVCTETPVSGLPATVQENIKRSTPAGFPVLTSENVCEAIK